MHKYAYPKRPRIFYPLSPNEIWHEKSLKADYEKGLKGKNYKLKKIKILGHVNAIFCPNTSLDFLSCQYKSDPRGSGIGLSGEIF